MKRMTPKMFWMQGRQTPIRVPRLAWKINRSINQSINQLLAPSLAWTINQSINQPIAGPKVSLDNQSINGSQGKPRQTINRSMGPKVSLDNQSIHGSQGQHGQLIHQSTVPKVSMDKQSINQWAQRLVSKIINQSKNAGQEDRRPSGYQGQPGKFINQSIHGSQGQPWQSINQSTDKYRAVSQQTPIRIPRLASINKISIHGSQLINQS